MTATALAAAALAASAVAVARSGVSRRTPLRASKRRRPWPITLPSLAVAPPSHAREVATLASAVASELRSGREPDQAWRQVVGQGGLELPGTALPEADLMTVLARWSGRPGWSGLAAVMVCWELADVSGVGLADALERVAESMRHEQDVAAEVQAQLTTTRATAVVLATLPLLAVVLGTLLGADLLGVLLGTWLGVVCLLTGLLLVGAGSWWVTRQVSGVHRVLRWR